MKRAMPWSNQVDVLSSDSSSSDSDSEAANGYGKANPSNKNKVSKPTEENTLEGAMIRRAEMYQEYMKQIQIPSHRASAIPFNSWQGLAKSIKLLYGQPLHYLTNVLLKQWDQSRIDTDNEHQPLDTIIHSCKAEATIWLMEEVHRLTTSHHHLARLWLSDPTYHCYVDPIFPPLDTAKTGRSKSNVIDFKALSEHGYKGGPSILNMPTPKEMDEKEPNWSWSTGKEKAANKDIEESYEERQRTRSALAEGEMLINVQTRKEKNLSFSQKEKRKRELGQASRGKNYVEEEKRLLRDSGVYSGFDA